MKSVSSKKSGVILGYLAMAITNLASFFLTPLMLSTFGTSDFGVYKLVITFTAYFALADLGLSNAVVRYVSEYRTNNDKVLEGKFVGVVTLIDLLMSLILVIGGILFYNYIPVIFDQSFQVEEIVLLKELFLLVMITGILTLFINFASGIIKSYERFSLLKSINIIKTVVRVALITILLLLDFSPFEIVLVDTVLMFLVFLYSGYFCFKSLKVRPIFKNIDLGYYKKILSYSLIVFIDAIAFHFFWAADVFIIGVLISSSAIAVYAIGTLIASLFFAFSIVISDVLMPEIVKMVTQGSDDKALTDHMIKIGRIKFIFLALPTIGFIFLGKQFIHLWVGYEFSEAYYIALLILIPQMISALTDVGLYIMWAKNKHLVKTFVSLAICIINIFLTIYLVKEYGIIGAAVSTCLAFIFGYLIFNSIYFHKVLKLDMVLFTKKILNKFIFGILIVLVGAYLVSTIDTTSWFILAVQCLVVTIFYSLTLWFFGFNSFEKNIVLTPIKKLLKK